MNETSPVHPGCTVPAHVVGDQIPDLEYLRSSSISFIRNSIQRSLMASSISILRNPIQRSLMASNTQVDVVRRYSVPLCYSLSIRYHQISL
jgi:hypothetical protein